MAGASDTRQRALDVALELFSRKGYDAVSMSDIAQALGIKAPSLYKHFQGKEALYAALTPVVDHHYQTLWAGVAQGQAQLEGDLRALGVLAAERLEQETLAWLEPELSARQAGSMRRLTALEQYAAGGQADRWLWAEPLALYEGFFDRLIQQEILRRGDPHVMAVEYLAPLVQLLSLADRQCLPPDQVLDEARRHIRQFHRIFAHRENRSQNTPRIFRR